MRSSYLFERYPDYADLLLRAALASRATNAPNARQLAQRLREQYAAHQRRGDFVPSRDYARFLLDIEGKASAALDAALFNWQSQREPADALIVVARRSQPVGRQPRRRWRPSSASTDWKMCDWRSHFLRFRRSARMRIFVLTLC